MRVLESELAIKADRLRVLVAQGCYREAQACFDDYCRDLKETLRRLPPCDPRHCQIVGEWRLLMEQTRRRVLTARAHLAARLTRLPRRRYVYSAASSPRRTWEILG